MQVLSGAQGNLLEDEVTIGIITEVKQLGSEIAEKQVLTHRPSVHSFMHAGQPFIARKHGCWPLLELAYVPAPLLNRHLLSVGPDHLRHAPLHSSNTMICRCKLQVAAKATEAAVDAARVAYAPAGDFAALLFFCISDLAAIDPMYQYSLPWCAALVLVIMHGWHMTQDVKSHQQVQRQMPH